MVFRNCSCSVSGAGVGERLGRALLFLEVEVLFCSAVLTIRGSVGSAASSGAGDGDGIGREVVTLRGRFLRLWAPASTKHSPTTKKMANKTTTWRAEQI